MRRLKSFVPGTAETDPDHEPEAPSDGRVAAHENDVGRGSLRVRGAGEGPEFPGPAVPARLRKSDQEIAVAPDHHEERRQNNPLDVFEDQ